jgi:hypothetical protein
MKKEIVIVVVVKNDLVDEIFPFIGKTARERGEAKFKALVAHFNPSWTDAKPEKFERVMCDGYVLMDAGAGSVCISYTEN